mgnify:CR=1 FL=1
MDGVFGGGDGYVDGAGFGVDEAEILGGDGEGVEEECFWGVSGGVYKRVEGLPSSGSVISGSRWEMRLAVMMVMLVREMV